MWWLVYRQGRTTAVFIVTAGDQYTARLKAGLAGLPTEHFAEALELDFKIANKVPKDIIERPLSREAAEKLLKNLVSHE
jgi:hypothetical protein